MPVELTIPKMGMTMKDGTVSGWLVDDGAEVAPGQAVFLLTTDKVETEVEAESGGTLRHAVPAGTTLDTGAVAGWVLAPGESAPNGSSEGGGTAPAVASGSDEVAPVALSAPPARAPGERLFASPNARRVAAQLGVDVASVTGTGPGGRIVSEDVEAAAASASSAPTVPAQPDHRNGGAAAQERIVVVSPLAKRLAEKLGVDLATVEGTGPGGRITTDDVGAAGSAAPVPERPPFAPRPPARDEPQPVTRIPLRGMRGVIAERMTTSLREMAQLSLGMDVDMGAAVALRRQLVEGWAADGLPTPGYTDLVVKAVAKALRRHPGLNAVVHDDEIELLLGVHVGVAVALDDGLVVPVIRDADLLPLADLAGESRRLADAARSKSLTVDEMNGGTFSVTSLGSHGVDFFTPVVNPPNVAILGVGRIRDDVAWRDDAPVKVQRMTLSLTIDHRAVDGAPAAGFLGEVKALLEAPIRLLA